MPCLNSGLLGPNFVRNMPSMKACAKMTDSRVYLQLSKISNSDYYGLEPLEIAKQVSHNEAVRYLNDLILVNDRNKSDLHLVTEKSIES